MARKQKYMSFAPTFSWRFLLSILLIAVSVANIFVAFADDLRPTLVIRPLTSITAEADEKVKITAVVDTTSTQPLAFVWEQKYGDHLVLRNDMTDTVSFVAPRVPEKTDYQLMVLVSDGVTQAHTDVTITVLPYQPQLPTANAGIDHSVHSGDTVILNAESSSDEDSLALTYEWKQITGPVVNFAPTHAITQFIAPVVDTVTVLEFQLTVRDEVGSGEDLVKVLVSPALKPISSSNQVSTPEPSALPASTHFPQLEQGQIIEPQSNLSRVEIVKQTYATCFPAQSFSKTKENSLVQKLLTEHNQPINDLGVTKIEMLRDVIVICDLLSIIPPTVEHNHYADITANDPSWWRSYAEFAYKNTLFTDEPLFLPKKTMNEADLMVLLAKIKLVKFPIEKPLLEATASAVVGAAGYNEITRSAPDQSAAASVLNKMVTPKFAVFAILFLVGFFCILYALIYSWRPARAKTTYISLPNSSPHDRR